MLKLVNKTKLYIHDKLHALLVYCRLNPVFLYMRDKLSALLIYCRLKPAFVPYQEESRLFLMLKKLNIFSFYLKCPKFASNFKYYFVTIKIPQIESLADPNIIAAPTLLGCYKQNKDVRLFYDLSTEAITFSEYPAKILRDFHEILKKFSIQGKHVYLVCANYNAEKYYLEWIKVNKLQDYKMNILGYNFYLFEYYWELIECKWLQTNKTLLLDSAGKTVLENKKRNKYFLCLNLRPRWHRTVIMLHLMERGYLEKGDVTYFGKEFADHDSVSKDNETIDIINKLESGKRIFSCWDELQKKAPIKLERDASQMRQDLWYRKPGEVEFLIPESEELQNTGVRTYFEIVTETWFTDNTALYLTEKTLRPILRLQPFIHVGTPFLLKYLRSIGFQTFSPYIDEGYDTIVNPIERIEVILAEIDRLCSLSIEEIHQMYCALWPRLLHNFQHLFESTKNTAKREIKKMVFNPIMKI